MAFAGASPEKHGLKLDSTGPDTNSPPRNQPLDPGSYYSNMPKRSQKNGRRTLPSKHSCTPADIPSSESAKEC